MRIAFLNALQENLETAHAADGRAKRDGAASDGKGRTPMRPFQFA